MSIGTRIRAARTGLKLTQAELSKKCGVTANAVSNYENDVSIPDVDKLSLIMKTLGVDPNYIYQDYFIGEELNSLAQSFSREELEIVTRYRSADDHTKKIVKTVLSIES